MIFKCEEIKSLESKLGGCLYFFNNGKMYFETREMPMSSSLDLFEKLFKNELSEDEYEKLSEDCYSFDSRVGGYPYFFMMKTK